MLASPSDDRSGILISDVPLRFEPFDEGSVLRCIARRVRYGFLPLVPAVSWAARQSHSVGPPDLSAHPWFRAKRRNHRSLRWLLARLVLDPRSLLRDCRNWHRPSENRNSYSWSNSRDSNLHFLGPPCFLLTACSCAELFITTGFSVS